MGKNKKKQQLSNQIKGKKILPKIRLQLNDLTDNLLKKCTSLPAGNPNKDWEDYKEIYSLVQEIREIESGFSPPLPQREDCWDLFLSWCSKNEAEFSNVEIQKFGEEHGLFTKKILKEDELFLAVPKKLMMTTLTAQESKLGPLIQKDPILQHMPNIVLALHLLMEYCDPDSFWKPYISILPSEYNTILYFTPEEIKGLQGSPVLDDALKLYRSIARQYSYFYNIFQTCSDARSLPLRECFTYDFYRWAVSTVMTRQNSIPSSDGSSTISALVPLWDMCNHAEGKLSTDFSLEKDCIECFSVKTYNVGDQVYIFYGPRPNAEFFIHNGFVYPENEHDALSVKLGISKSDPLHSLKSQLLSRLGMLVNGIYVLNNSDKPVEGYLFTFLKVNLMNKDDLISCLEKVDVSELLIDTGNNALVTNKALLFLRTRCSLLMKSYPTTIEEDEELLKSSTLNSHQQMVCQLLIGEKRILQRTLSYLEHLEKALSTEP